MTDEKLKQADERTEEVQSIIERMPTRFGVLVSMIVLLLFIFMFVFGWIVRYPDIVVGRITINANVAPLKLIANSNGKIKLNHIKSMDWVKEGSVIAYIENPTDLRSVIFVDSLLKFYNPNSGDIRKIYSELPYNFSMGELNAKYYAFANSLQEFMNYKDDKLFDKQGESYKELEREQKKAVSVALERITMVKKSLDYSHKFYSRDSILFINKVISESEMDKSQMTYLTSKDALQNAYNNLINAKQTLQQTQSKLRELGIQKPEKEKELRIALISSYNDLVDNIKSWEQKYVFKSPFTGRVQFLKFYSENQFVQTGEEVFTVVPKEEKAFGQLILPAQGSGKVKRGQEVVIKLDNYPYMEYGSIVGRVKSISLTTSVERSEKNEMETYMVLVDFPKQLKTNYGAKLDFKAESKGSAEIITNDRRLIERLFDNLKYVTKR